MSKYIVIVISCVCIGLINLVGVQNKIIKINATGQSYTDKADVKKGKVSGKQEENEEQSSSTFEYSNMSFTENSDMNFLELLHWVQTGKQDNTEQKYFLNLIELYTEGWQGKYNDLGASNPPPSLYSILHYNETSWGDFIKPVFGETYNGQTIDLRMTDKGVVQDLLTAGRISRSGSVWKDANGDGLPDGPFQVEHGSPDGKKEKRSKDSKYSTFDVYSFRDQMNEVAFTYQSSLDVIQKNNLTDNNVVKTIYAVANHNRGSQIRQAHGIAYEPSSPKIKTSNFIKVGSNSKEDIQEQLYAPTLIYESFQKYSIDYLKCFMEDNSAGAIAWVIFMKDGWKLEAAPPDRFLTGLKSIYNETQGKVNPVTTMFPEWTTYEKAVSEINAKYVKKLSSELGTTDADVDKRYGTSGGTYVGRVIASQGSAGSYSFMYKAFNDVRDDIYTTAGTRLVKAYDFVCSKYFVQVGMMGESKLIELAIKAGAPKQFASAEIDPTNPSAFYKKTSNTYNPMNGGDADALNRLLTKFNITDINQAQYMVLLETYKVSGGGYAQGGGVWGTGSKTPGKPKHDCSTLVSVGFSLGVLENEWRAKHSRNTTGWKSDAYKPMTITKDGVEYDVSFVQVNKDGTIRPNGPVDSSQAMKQSEWAKVLKPGDAVSTYNRGHAEMFFGVNNTSDTLIIPPEETKRGEQKTFKPGVGAWLAANGDGQINGLNTGWDANMYCAYRLRICENPPSNLR